jgi:hypothetical protein
MQNLKEIASESLFVLLSLCYHIKDWMSIQLNYSITYIEDMKKSECIYSLLAIAS